MRPLKIKDRCTKKKLKKCQEVARTYDKIQTAYAEVLDKDKNIENIKCNVLLENLEDGEFTTDFLCTKTNGDLMVRECVFRKKLYRIVVLDIENLVFYSKGNPALLKQ